MQLESSRRKMLQKTGLMLGSMFFPWSSWARDEYGAPMILPKLDHRPDKPVTAITLGAGSRGNVYGNFALEFRQHLNIIGVAEPVPIRNERYSKKHDIPEGNRFTTWEHVFERSKFADAVIISTPDDLHFGPCMKALELGYDVLLEKPIAPSEQECRDILAMAQKTGQIVAVCHVLRYAPYFITLRRILKEGAIGQMVSMQHFEPIEHVHMSHSFVRGNWHNSKATAPIILAKSCHDLDIIRWLIDQPSQKIQAFGNLSWFRKENAPQGSTARCMEGCAVEPTCPYSALKIYYRNRSWTYVFDLPDDKDQHGEAILDYLKNTNYGRCVYRMENDQCDHYVSNILFEKGVTASFSMEAFTPWGGRRTRIMGSHGYIEGDMDKIQYYDFTTGRHQVLEARVEDVENYSGSGHGGGDWRLVADWVHAVAKNDRSVLSSSIEASIESHLMGFAAEKSRLNNTVELITL